MATEAPVFVTNGRMAKKKPSGGQHTTQRKPIQFPIDWYKLAYRMAAKKQQPMTWYILKLIADDAEKEGIDRPKLPWENGNDA